MVTKNNEVKRDPWPVLKAAIQKWFWYAKAGIRIPIGGWGVPSSGQQW